MVGTINVMYAYSPFIEFPLKIANFSIWEHVAINGAIIYTTGVIPWIVSGGVSLLQHIILRVTHALAGVAPYRIICFLDYCAQRNLLHKVGGGYIFIHRLLMNYFASLTDEDIKRLSAEVESPQKIPLPRLSPESTHS
jgi:hypothetical protein